MPPIRVHSTHRTLALLGLLVIAPALAAAQSSRLPEDLVRQLAGEWTGCFTTDSAIRTLDGTPHLPRTTCGPVTFHSNPVCGGSALTYILGPLSPWWSPKPNGPVPDTITIGFRAIDSMPGRDSAFIEFGGRVKEDTTIPGSRSTCWHSADDGSLFGDGWYHGDTIAGKWSVSGYMRPPMTSVFRLTRAQP